MFCVGLTGNIATGKTTVSKEFQKQGVKLISADAIAKDLTKKDSPAYQEIRRHFGDSILLDDQQLDRKALRSIIFSNPQEKLWLENLLHPFIRKEIEQQLNLTEASYVLIEIPLLFKRDLYPYIDRVLVIITPQSIQLKRIMERDNCSSEEALAIMDSQPDQKERLLIADDILVNDGDREALQRKVEELHLKYLQNISD